MKEKPILFKSGMVRAILDGRKTQTRRTNKLESVNNRADDCENLLELVLANTAWFEDFVAEQEQRVWKRLKEAGYDALNAGEVKIR